MSGTYVPVPLDVLTTPREGECYVDRWWMVGPDGALFWKGSNSRRGYVPQCNKDRRAVVLFLQAHGAEENLEPVFVPVAYLGHWDPEWGFLCPWIEAEKGPS